MRAQDPPHGTAPLVEAQRQSVPDVAAHEFHVGVVGRAVEEHRGEGREAEAGGGGDPVLAVDDGPVGAPHDDRRPVRGELGEGGDVRGVETPGPERGRRPQLGERDLHDVGHGCGLRLRSDRHG